MDSKTIKTIKFVVSCESQYFGPDKIAERYCKSALGMNDECARLVKELYRKEQDIKDEF
ncbi:MAG: hypothetical protein QW774_00690 [Candidatus Micrarchaeaceae archaeon]